MLLCSAATCEADQMWTWSFAGEAGHFLTDGATPVPGTYTLIDFDVTSSAAGGRIGSVSGGQYLAEGSDSVQPYAMMWDGHAVTLFTAAGFNSFNWWPFSDQDAHLKAYLFGWAFSPLGGQVNDVHSAGLWDGRRGVAIGRLTVRPAASSNPTPEPASLMLVAGGLAGIASQRRRRRRSGQLSVCMHPYERHPSTVRLGHRPDLDRCYLANPPSRPSLAGQN
jgi:hypothetical protein